MRDCSLRLMLALIVIKNLCFWKVAIFSSREYLVDCFSSVSLCHLDKIEFAFALDLETVKS
jgi:hypothetical protein